MATKSLKLAHLKALALDCDGVLTDGRIYYDREGVAMKAFDSKDGMGLSMLRKAGIRVAIISVDRAAALDRRAEKLGIVDVYQGVDDKVATLRSFARRYLLDLSEIGYMGDDLNDLKLMAAAGVSFAPADAVEAVRRAADRVTAHRGGRGAVREVAELILRAKTRRGARG